MNVVLLAMDRAPTGRRMDVDGHMHIAHNNIAAASVSPYYGREIPGHAALGLDPNRVYKMFRCPKELAKNVDTFNGKPILIEHRVTTANDHQTDLVVGTTGTHAVFDGKFVDNAVSLWEGMAIDGVMANRRRQLSPCYRYDPDMTPGNFEGVQYDGIMRNPKCNHVALVFVGRQGPDVLVGDENTMKTRTALMVSGALAGLVRPLLAQDAKVDLTVPLADVSAATLAMDSGASIAEAVHALAVPHLAADKTLTVEDVQAAINAVPATPIAEDALTVAAPAPAPNPFVKPDSPVIVALDEATVQARIDAAVAQAASAASAIRTAERDVEPHIGQVAAMDSAEDYYRMALDGAKVDHKGVDSLPALKAMVGMLTKPGETLAQDAAFTEAPYDDLFKGATRLVRS